jgi:hypothetical protein
MKTLLTYTYALLKSFSPTTTLMFGALTALLAVNTYFNQLWASLFSRIDAIVVPSGGSIDFSPLGLINYVFPLDTGFTLLSAYGSLYVLCAGVRIIKSFVPTIS